MLVQHDPGAPLLPAPMAFRVPPQPVRRTLLRVQPWRDEVIDQVGYDPRSDYVETFWLPVLGPSCVWLLRHFTIRLEQVADEVVLDLEQTARSLGLGERLGPNAPFARTVKRCVDFDMAEWRAPEVLAVRLMLPPLARRHVRRLPESLRSRYESAGTQSVQNRYESALREIAQVGSVLHDQGEDLPRNGTRARADL